MKGSFGAAVLVAGCMLLVSCGERQGLAPVEELRWIPFNENALLHVVRPKDTLFSIAFRYEKDYHQLAKLNHIRPPYNIKPGQRIRLAGASLPKAPVRKKRGAILSQYYRPSNSNISWQWPLKGKLKQEFSPAFGRKGIDICVDKQQPVRAASDGVVAYSGDGIPGYGHLIIVKHNQQYLTAYAHNAKNLVKEGQKVTKGQEIAYTGLISSHIRGVHFELRKNGKPVNPLNYLTKG